MRQLLASRMGLAIDALSNKGHFSQKNRGLIQSPIHYSQLITSQPIIHATNLAVSN
jgi:hypothetical protein